MLPKQTTIVLAALTAFATAGPVPTVSVTGKEPATAHGDCTSTLLRIPSLTSGPTRTVWTATATKTITVPCGGCANVAQHNFAFGPGPAIFFTATTTATEATTTTTWVCSPTSGLKDMLNSKAESIRSLITRNVHAATVMATSTGPWPTLNIRNVHPDSTTTPLPKHDELSAVTARPFVADEPDLAAHTVVPTGKPAAECTITRRVFAGMAAKNALLRYNATVTSTSTQECGSCAMVWSTVLPHFLVAPHITTTIDVAQPTTKTMLACGSVSDQ